MWPFSLRRTQITIFIFVSFLLAYFCISNLWLPAVIPESYRPPYQLTSFSDLSNLHGGSDESNIGDVHEEFKKFIVTPSFFATSERLHTFVSYGIRNPQLFHPRASQGVAHNSDTFKCICGRVSDACNCCGVLNTCVNSSRLPPALCEPLVLHSAGDKHAATFCLNITYIPSKQQVKTSGFLVSQLPSDGLGAISTQHFTFTNMRILFADIFVPIDSPPVYCAENSRTKPDLAVCFSLNSLRYSSDSNSEYKTIFKGCGNITLWMKRRLLITDYGEFCFKAHQGASGDMDKQLSAALQPVNFTKLGTEAQKDPVVNNPQPVNILDGSVGNP